MGIAWKDKYVWHTEALLQSGQSWACASAVEKTSWDVFKLFIHTKIIDTNHAYRSMGW